MDMIVNDLRSSALIFKLPTGTSFKSYSDVIKHACFEKEVPKKVEAGCHGRACQREIEEGPCGTKDGRK